MRRYLRPASAGVLLLGLAGCTAAPAATPTPVPPGRTAASAAAAPPAVPARLSAARLAVTLPAALSRPVVFAAPGGLLVAGGLTTGQRTTAAVLRVDLAGAKVSPDGALARPVHDAAGATVAGQDLVFGGGTAASVATVQALVPGAPGRVVGQLPQARSDLVAAATGGAAYLLGGYTGVAFSPAVLRTTDGVSFTVVATLPVPVRYPALIATPTALWLAGGELPGGRATDVVQRVDLATGTAVVAGRLPGPLAHAAGFALAGGLYLAGGGTGGRPGAAILRLDPATGTAAATGSLPLALSDAGVAVSGTAAYLVGGETPQLLTSIIEIKAAVP